MKIDLRERFEKSWFYKTITSKSVRDSFIIKIAATAIVSIVVFIPTYLYLLIRWLIHPVDFWQELATLFVCVFFLGWLQVLFLIFGILGVFTILFEDI